MQSPGWSNSSVEEGGEYSLVQPVGSSWVVLESALRVLGNLRWFEDIAWGRSPGSAELAYPREGGLLDPDARRARPVAVGIGDGQPRATARIWVPFLTIVLVGGRQLESVQLEPPSNHLFRTADGSVL